MKTEQNQNQDAKKQTQQTSQNTDKDQSATPRTNTQQDQDMKSSAAPDKSTQQPKTAKDADGGQGGYSAEPEKRETSKEREGMQQERKLGDVNVDREQQENTDNKTKNAETKTTTDTKQQDTKKTGGNDYAANRDQNLNASRAHTQRH